MKNKKIQKIQTLDGFMVPIYRDWDKETNEGHIPKMVYATYLKPGVEKDIILHKERSAYISCIYGKVKAYTYENDKVVEHDLDFENSEESLNLLIIEPNIPLKLVNKSDSMSILINCPSPAWHPENQDTFKFKSWEDYLKCQD